MTDQAATPDGGAEVSARPQEAAASVHDRLKAALFGSAEPEKESGGIAPDTGKPQEQQAPQQEDQAQQEAEEVDGQTEVEPQSGAQEEDTQEQTFETVEELAEALGWDADKLFALSARTKIDGKEGKATLRDLIKSHQLEAHLNQKLMTHAEEKKAFEAETQRKVGEIQARVQQLNQAVVLAQKILDGEFADVNWQELQRTDPLEFQSKYGAYKMRLDGIQQLSQAVQQESQQIAARQQAEFNSYKAEQAKLLDSKVPEWSDATKREKGVAELAATLSEAYGITEKELRSIVDHRHILMARDAAAYRKLQQAKPTVINKVKTAPKLLKPGTTQSRAAQSNLQLQQDRARLKESGKVRDATPLLKQRLFAQSR